MVPTVFQFWPRPITIARADGWDVVAQDEVSGDAIALSPDTGATRAPRGPGPVHRKDLFVPFGARLERAPVIDGHRVETTAEAKTYVYRLTALATGRATELRDDSNDYYRIPDRVAIRGDLALVVQLDERHVHAFALPSGRRVWQATLRGVVGAGFLGATPVACTADGELVQLDQRSGKPTGSVQLAIRGAATVRSGATGVFVHHDRGVVFVDARGPHVVLDELVAEPAFSAHGDTWCRTSADHTVVVVGHGRTPPRSLALAEPVVGVWADARGLAWSTADAIAFVPLGALARDGDVTATARPVVDPRPPQWTTATVTVASKSFLIVQDAWRRRTYGWVGAGFAKGDTFDAADFVRAYAADAYRDLVDFPTLARRGDQRTTLVGGVPRSPPAASVKLGTARAFAAAVHDPAPVVELLLARALITRTPAVDRAIAAGITDAALVLQHAHGVRDGADLGFVSYDHKVFNDTDDPVADLVRIAAEPRLRGHLRKATADRITFELAGKTSSLDIDEELIASLVSRFNAALAALGATRRIYQLGHTGDFFALLACDADTRDALGAAGVTLDDAS